MVLIGRSLPQGLLNLVVWLKTQIYARWMRYQRWTRLNHFYILEVLAIQADFFPEFSIYKWITVIITLGVGHGQFENYF